MSKDDKPIMVKLNREVKGIMQEGESIKIEWKGVVDLYLELRRLKEVIEITNDPNIKILLCNQGLEIVNIIKAQESLNSEIKEFFSKILSEIKNKR